MTRTSGMTIGMLTTSLFPEVTEKYFRAMTRLNTTDGRDWDRGLYLITPLSMTHNFHATRNSCILMATGGRLWRHCRYVFATVWDILHSSTISLYAMNLLCQCLFTQNWWFWRDLPLGHVQWALCETWKWEVGCNSMSRLCIFTIVRTIFKANSWFVTVASMFTRWHL